MNKKIEIGQNIGNVYIGDSPESRVDSVINFILNILSTQEFKLDACRRKPSAKTIVKINHNNLQSKSHIIKQYLDRSSTIESAFFQIDSIIPFGKSIALRNLNDLYFEALDEAGIEYLTVEKIDITKIRENSEFIIDYIIVKLKNIALESKNISSYREEIDAGVNVVVAHAFIECVIMETPENDT